LILGSSDKSVREDYGFFALQLQNQILCTWVGRRIEFSFSSSPWLPVLQGETFGPNAKMIQAGQKASRKFLNNQAIPRPIWEDPNKLSSSRWLFEPGLGVQVIPMV
jgi:hypothetical protein